MRNAITVSNGLASIDLAKHDGRWYFLSSGCRITRAGLRQTMRNWRVVKRFTAAVS